LASRYNLDVLEGLYQQWRTDPESVDEQWRLFFEGFEFGLTGAASAADTSAQIGVFRLIIAYRSRGHLLARLDPLNEPPPMLPQLDLPAFGLSEADLDRTFSTPHFLAQQRGTLRDLVTALRDTYCRTIGVEYMHIQDSVIRSWLQVKMEPRRNRPDMAQRQKIRILMELHFAELFEKFLHARFMGQKRFSLEGAETLIPILDAIAEKAADEGVRELVFGMAHRGRLNVLANVMHKPYEEIFSEFEDNFLPMSIDGDGDVKYHLGFSTDRTSARGNHIHLSLTPNPSHLEAVNPVVEGRTRAKQQHFGDRGRSLGIPVLIHGDAAFAGQGLVAETLNLSQLPGYRTGGTIHIIVNNQIGFTTSPSDARSTVYCTDVAKMIEVPIFHVNGEDPEAVVYAAELALEFRQQFHKDVVIDMYCYRRHGHNEGDEPAFTQPLMYAKIQERPTLSEVYTEQLIMRGDLTVDETQAIVHEFQAKLQGSLQTVRSEPPRPVGMRGYSGHWKGLSRQYSHAPVPTGVAIERLDQISHGLTSWPEGFAPHPKLVKLLEARAREMADRKPLDWATAELLAFGSLVLEQTPVRLSGQDSRRGTFSQRHAVLYDVNTGEPYYPLLHLAPAQAPFTVYDSLLSEAAVLGFEFGYALDSPEELVLWEAQFGDFANGAQVIIDQFISCCYSKWQRDSGVVLLLPHGYEGQGPEHSSARLERFLQLCAEDNMQVCYPTTPAQHFHLLRRQVRRTFRKPLVVMTPKSLLRNKRAVSPVEDLTTGHFQEVLDDPAADPGRVRRIVLCSGKVFYDLLERREAAGINDVALVRLEQFHPFPSEQLQRVLGRYRKAQVCVWAQEESHNMGGWFFVEPLVRALGADIHYVGRDSSASPATGSRQVHLREQKELVEAALRGDGEYLVRAVPRGNGQAQEKAAKEPAASAK
jgi:2-oxoglutarate dehydrogenase E1 component